MFGKSRYNFWLDLSILTAFLVTAVTGLLLWLVLPHGPGSQSSVFLGLTRYAWIDIHDWAGLAMLLGAATHIALHWKWILCVAGRYFKRLARQARINFSLNSLLFIAFFLVSLSGLVAKLVLQRHVAGLHPPRLERYTPVDGAGHDSCADRALCLALELADLYGSPLRSGRGLQLASDSSTRRVHGLDPCE